MSKFAYVIFLLYLCSPFRIIEKKSHAMTTNAHILTLQKQLDEAKSLVHNLPQSVEKDGLMVLLDEMQLQLVCADSDMEKHIKRVGELAAENYGTIVNAQACAEHYFCYITSTCFQRRMADHVESHLRKACTGTAKHLWKTIHEYEMMQFMNTEDLSAAKLYRDLTEHFGTLPFTERAFRAYR